MSQNIQEVQSLLDSVSEIIKKHETEANYTGENYNIFSVMSMETDEEFTHSRIIGNLLNPKGKHGCGDFFLKKFVEQLNSLFDQNQLYDLKLNDFGTLVNERIVERYAGEVDNKNITGGSIDIVIEDDKQILLIENKIYASDQKYQLARYYNYAKTRGNKKIVMLYLTLDGKNLSNNDGILINENNVYNIPTIVDLDDKNTLKFDSFEITLPIDQKQFDTIELEKKCLYTPISYKNFIKDWLEACFFFVDNRPMIYYPLKHYYNLIKKLTNQSISKVMEKEILDTIFSKNYLKEFKKLTELGDIFKRKLVIEYFKSIFPNSILLGQEEQIEEDCVYKISEINYDYDKKLHIWLWVEKIDKIYIGFGDLKDKTLNKKYSQHFSKFEFQGLKNFENKSETDDEANEIWLASYDEYFNSLTWEEIIEIIQNKGFGDIINYNNELINKIEEELTKINY